MLKPCRKQDSRCGPWTPRPPGPTSTALIGSASTWPWAVWSVHRGDIVVADSDGVIVVPLAESERTLAGARAVLDDEAVRYQKILSQRTH